MRPRRDLRAGYRRDDGVRSIRATDVRYPGSDLPPNVAPPVSQRDAGSPTNGGPVRLAPALDTGIAVDTRTARRERSAAQRRRQIVITIAAVLGVLLLAGMGWRWASDRTVANSGGAWKTSGGGTASQASGGAVAAHPQSPVAMSTATRVEPTPIFARQGTLMLHLPVPVAKLTEIGFHQASYPYALRMKTPMKDANVAKAAKAKTTGRVVSAQPTGDHYLTGLVIRMWRARPGKPDTAADVGASPGTQVLSPVNGTVVKIKSYKLYGKYPDYELHFAPDGRSNLDVVMIHVTSLDCYEGMRVIAGITPVAKVRKLSDKFHDQLADYTKNGGDHVHLQVNDATYPGYKGLNGAVAPSDDDTEPAN